MIKLTALATLTGYGSTPNIAFSYPWAVSYHACMDQTRGDVDTSANTNAEGYKGAKPVATANIPDDDEGNDSYHGQDAFEALSIISATLTYRENDDGKPYTVNTITRQ